MERWMAAMLVLLSGQVLRATEAGAPIGPCWVEAQFRASSPVPTAVLDAAREEVDRVWAPYEVTIAWVAGVWQGPGRLVQIVLRGDRRRDAVSEAGDRGLAWIEFLQGLPRDVIDVSIPAIRDVVRRSGYLGRRVPDLPPYNQDALLARVIGRVVAHELGHYLLASTHHAKRGLMRASISADDFLSADAGHFLLERDEAAALVASGVARGVCQPVLALR